MNTFAGQGYGTLKKAVVEVAIETVGHVQARYYQIQSEAGYLDQVLKDGTERATSIANTTLGAAMRRTGLM